LHFCQIKKIVELLHFLDLLCAFFYFNLLMLYSSVQAKERENTLALNNHAIRQWMERQEAADVVAGWQEETEGHADHLEPSGSPSLRGFKHAA
jgi:hypothetical protein